MTIAFTRTREQIAHLVLGKIQNVRSTEALSVDMELVYEAIDLRVKEIHALGIFWRKVERVPLPFALTASTVSASASGDILFPISMTVSNGSLDEPVMIVGAREYAAITNKTEGGRPLKAVWKGGAEFLFWPVPSAAATAKLVYEKIADDTAAASAPDVEVSMMRSLSEIVKADVAEHFGVDDARILRWEKKVPSELLNIRRLSVERKSLTTIAVDDHGERMERRPTDYGR